MVRRPGWRQMRGAPPGRRSRWCRRVPRVSAFCGHSRAQETKAWRFLAPGVGGLSVKENIDADLVFTRRSAFVSARW